MQSAVHLLVCCALMAAALASSAAAGSNHTVAADIEALEQAPETVNGTVATEANGTTAYWIYGDPSGPRVALVMGLAYTHYAWEDTIVFLVQRGWRVLAMDNRGVGASAVTAGPYSIALLARDVRAALKHAGWLPPSDADAPATPVHLAGISMGGMISQRLVLDTPHAFASVAFVSTSPGGNIFQRLPSLAAISNLVSILASGDADLYKQARLLHTAAHLATDGDRIIGGLHRVFALGGAIGNAPMFAQMRAILAHDLRGQLKALKGRLPMVVLTGDSDDLISYKRGKALAAEIGVPIYIAKGAGHGLVQDYSDGQGWFNDHLYAHLQAAQAGTAVTASNSVVAARR